MPLRILIVDDEVKMAKRIRGRLVQRGYKVDCAMDGQEGLKKFRRQEYDAVILDIVMPKMNGMRLLAEIRSASYFVPVIILTAYADKGNATESARQHVFDYVEKPIGDWKNFLATVERAARSKDPTLLAIEEWFEGLPAEERQRPQIFEGRASYSPQQLLQEVRRNTEFGQRQRLSIGKFIADLNLERME